MISGINDTTISFKNTLKIAVFLMSKINDPKQEYCFILLRHTITQTIRYHVFQLDSQKQIFVYKIFVAILLQAFFSKSYKLNVWQFEKDVICGPKKGRF